MITVPALPSPTLDMITAVPMKITHGNVSFSSWTCDWHGWGSVRGSLKEPLPKKIPELTTVGEVKLFSLHWRYSSWSQTSCLSALRILSIWQNHLFLAQDNQAEGRCQEAWSTRKCGFIHLPSCNPCLKFVFTEPLSFWLSLCWEKNKLILKVPVN